MGLFRKQQPDTIAEARRYYRNAKDVLARSGKLDKDGVAYIDRFRLTNDIINRCERMVSA